MPQTARRWSPYLIVSVTLVLCGCSQKSDEGFHTYNESGATPKTDRGSDTPAPASGTPPVVAPPAESAVAVSEVNSKSAAPAAATPPNPEQSTTASPPPAAQPAAEPAPAVSPNHELALALPPAPPEAVVLSTLSSTAGTAAQAREIKLLIPEKEFQVEGPEDAVRVTFDDIDLLKVLNADPVPVDIEKHLPSWLSGLNGKMVRIRGWMFPPNQETDLPAFLFVRDNQICCFGRKPMVYDKFGVRLREGVTTNYIQGRPFDVVGRMVVKSRLVDGELFWLYMINDAIVIDK